MTAHLRIWNESRIVDAYRLTLIGPPAHWPGSEADLGQLAVYPGTYEKINIPLVLPRDSNLAPGTLVFAVRVSSTENPNAIALPEGIIQVGKFHATDVAMIRRRAAGALWSSNLVQLRNTGNAVTTFRLRADPEDEVAPLRTRLRRSRLKLQPGEAARVGLSTRVTGPTVTGRATTWRVTVRISAPPMEECTVAFVHRQRPIMPKPALRAAIALAAAVVATTALWLSPVGGQRPKAKTESAKGPSQEQAREQTQKQAAAAAKAEADKESQKQEQASSLRKQNLQYSLFVDSVKGPREDTYTVRDGYRLVVKTVQITASGPATGIVILKAGIRPLASMGVDRTRDYTPPTPLSLKEGAKLAIDLDCETAAKSPHDATSEPDRPPLPPAPSTLPATGCTSTAVITGELVPLEGPFAEPETPTATS
ncbi:hypothetical protein [Streptomyces sp. MS2.AVA.5]|uniref:Uncharacterized protein n=1 Tax=Streptomyces achmelvichensis TaxID=3134111 RepID=A0ACC6PL74_9ACTN